MTVQATDGPSPSPRAFGTYAILVLHQALVVSADRYQEHKAVDVLEAMYPLLPFGSLTTDIEHPVRQLAQVEDRLGDTGRLQSGLQEVLVCRNVTLLPETVEVIAKARGVLVG